MALILFVGAAGLKAFHIQNSISRSRLPFTTGNGIGINGIGMRGRGGGEGTTFLVFRVFRHSTCSIVALMSSLLLSFSPCVSSCLMLSCNPFLSLGLYAHTRIPPILLQFRPPDDIFLPRTERWMWSDLAQK